MTTHAIASMGIRYVLVAAAWLALAAPAMAQHAPATEDNAAERAAEQAAAEQADALLAEEAVARYERLLQRRPFHDAAFRELVKHVSQRGALAELVTHYEQRAEALEDNFAARVVLARLYLRSGKAEQAAKLVDQLGEPPEEFAAQRSDLLVFKAEVYQRTERTDAALEMLAQALADARSIAQRMNLTEALADLHLRRDAPDEAAAVLQALGEAYAQDYLQRKRVADALAERDLYAAAEAEYRALLELVANETDRRCEVLRQLGRTLEAQQKPEEAIDAYAEAMGLLAPDHWLQRDLHERTVALHRAAGRLDALIEYCEAQLERTPENIPMRMLLADVQAAAGDEAAALQTLADAVELFPRDRALSERRIQMLERADRPEAVADEYERIIAGHPDALELYIGYGQFLAGNERLEAARNQWRRVLQSELADALLAVRLGALFETYELPDDARDCYERAITLAPDNPDGYVALARLRYFAGEADEAREVLDRMASANPDDAALHARRSQALLGLQMYDAALQAIERACALAPDSDRYLLAQADLLVRSGRLKDALRARRNAIDLMQNPLQRARAIAVLASMYASADQLAELIEAEQQRLAAEPGDVTSMLLLAEAADLQRDFPAAERRLRAVLEVDPAHEQAQVRLAELFEAQGDVDGAVAIYQRLIEQQPTRARQYYQAIADAMLRVGDRPAAIRALERLARQNADNATVLSEVAEQLVRLREFERAIEQFERSLRVQPQRYEVQLGYGDALREAGRLEVALAAYRQAAMQTRDRDVSAEALGRLHDTAMTLGELDPLLEDLQLQVETDPGNTTIARMLAQLLIREFEYNRAEQLLQVVLRHHPREAELHLVRAELLRRLTRFDEAVQAYERILRLPNLDRDYVLGELGKAQFEAGRVEEAERIWRQINHRLYAGTLLRNNGLINEAIELFREGIRLKPDDYALWRNLIRALQEAGQTDEALAAARRLLDLQPDDERNVRRLAEAYLERGDRVTAAEIAARLFGTSARQVGGAPQQQNPNMWAMRGMYGMPGGGDKLDRAIRFFMENGLQAELEEVLEAQMASQPDNAVLRLKSVQVFENALNKPARALAILRELESAEFPVEYQSWQGGSSREDHFRVQQYQLIARKPSLRDQRLGLLETRAQQDELTREEKLELAVIRQAQGVTDEAVKLLEQVVVQDERDVVALSMLADTLFRAERYVDAEPHVKRLAALLAERRAQQRAAMIERLRREYVRTLPMQFQMRITDELLGHLADKWTLGAGFEFGFDAVIDVMGYARARLTLATIYAKTDRAEEARAIWRTLEPRHPADADSWANLAAAVQQHDQRDLAYNYYQRALQASKRLTGDTLLQQVFGGYATRSWFSGGQTVDTAFNNIVEVFAENDQLIALYDYLRETEQGGTARRIARQYKMQSELVEHYEARFAEAQTTFAQDAEDPFQSSVPLFAAACKLAELHDQSGDWPAARAVYEEYLAAFPDELGLLVTLSEVAEARGEYDDAVAWERRALAAKERLSRERRGWTLRQVQMMPGVPQVLEDRYDSWDWQQRWGRSWGWRWGAYNDPLDRWTSWMRIGRLYLALDNPIAAADALERAVSTAGPAREYVANEVLGVIRERRLVGRMLPVVRSLAIQMPTHEQIQLAFAESLAANERPEVAVEVYKRMLRRGVSNVGVLAQVRRELAALQPEDATGSATTLAALQAESEADPQNANKLLRLAKAQYYSLDLEAALESLQRLEALAPHLEGVHDLLVEVYTIQDDRPALIAALRAKIDRATDENDKRVTRRRLVEVLLADGRTDEALAVLKELPDPRNPQTFTGVGVLLHYFNRHDEAIEQFELAERSTQQARWNAPDTGGQLARSYVIKGDIEQATDTILRAVDKQLRQQTQYGGMPTIYAMVDDSNLFAPYASLLILDPELSDTLQTRLEERRAENPQDPGIAKLVRQFYSQIGRHDRAQAILDELVGDGVTDQALVNALIDRALQQNEYEQAIKLAKRFIEQQPKLQLPPGMPSAYAAQMVLQSPRALMLCTLGDVYWKMGDADQAFATYQQIVDDDVEISKLAYAAICMVRGREDEARRLLNETLAAQQVKSKALLEFQTLLVALEDDDGDALFDALQAVVEAAADEGDNSMSYMYGGASLDESTLATLARNTGRVERFVEFMNERIAKNPDDWEPRRILIETLTQAGRTAEAQALLAQAAEKKGMRHHALREQISSREQTAPPEELIPLYEQLIEAAEKADGASNTNRSARFGYRRQRANVSTQELRQRLGELLWEVGEQERAVAVWTERLNLKQSASHIRLAGLFSAQDDDERARAAYERALELDPKNQTAHRELALLCLDAGEQHAAAAHVRELFVRGADAQQAHRYGQNQGITADSQLRFAALALVDDREVLMRLTADQDRTAREKRLALAVLTGDWDTIAAELDIARQETPYDPLVWKLLARTAQRRGDWKAAIDALQRLRRLEQTTITDHRDQLKLVLAADHIRDARAGIRSSDPNSNPAASMSGMPPGFTSYSYRGYGGAAVDEHVQRLVQLHLQRGDFEAAERLYLVAAQSQDPQWVVRALAGLMWRQDAKERAAELQRLSLVLGTDTDTLPRYADMLNELGKRDEAARLLVQAYRCIADESARLGSWIYSLYGMPSGDTTHAFESWEEQRLSDMLYRLLKQSDRLETFRDETRAQLRAEPNDKRLAKLLLSLEIKDGNWAAVRAALRELLEQRPFDDALRVELLHAHLQLQEWDAALETLAQLRAAAPGSAHGWALYEAYCKLMQDDRAGALAAINPLLEDETYRIAGVPLDQIAAVLLFAGDYARLEAYLAALREQHLLDENARRLLCAVYQARGADADAARLAFAQVWRDERPLSESHYWVRQLALALHAAGDAEPYRPGRAEDRALAVTLTQSPAAGAAAFAALVAADPDNIAARRGLIFAYELAGEWRGAADANAALTELLQSRRNQTRRVEAAQPLSAYAHAMLRRFSGGDFQSSSLLMLSGNFGNLLAELITAADAERETYDDMWREYAVRQPQLLYSAGDWDAGKDLAREQAELAAAHAWRNRFGARQSAYSYYQPSHQQYGASAVSGNWRHNYCTALTTRLRFAELQRELAEDLPRYEGAWVMAAHAAAAVGDQDRAATHRRLITRNQLAGLRAQDEPQFGNAQDHWRWYYGWYGEDAQREQQVQFALLSMELVPDNQPEPADRGTRFEGLPNALWEWTLIDPQARDALAALQDTLGPGWANTQTFAALRNHYAAADQPDQVLALYDRVFEEDQLLAGSELSGYLTACLRAGAYERYTRLLDRIEQSFPGLRPSVELARLVGLRHAGDTAAADALEARLLANAPRAVVPPMQFDERLRFTLHYDTDYSYSYSYSPWGSVAEAVSWEWEGVWQGWKSSFHAQALAESLGVRFDAPAAYHPGATEIAQRYASCGLHHDAARVLAALVADPPAELGRRAAQHLRTRLAEQLALAGDHEEARRQAEILATQFRDEINTDPTDTFALWSLLALYAGEEHGYDYAAALETLRETKRLDPGFDADHEWEAWLLLKLERYDEAWALYDYARCRGTLAMNEVATLYHVAIAAAHAGQGETAQQLLRLALWCDPAHSRAPEAQELLNERTPATAARGG